MSSKQRLTILLSSLLIIPIANSFLLLRTHHWLALLMIPVLLTVIGSSGICTIRTRSPRLRICHHGVVLLNVFLSSGCVGIVFHLVLAFLMIPDDLLPYLGSILQCVLVEGIVFWVGIVCLYTTSLQLGIRRRILGILCGMLPVVNLLILHRMIGIATEEVRFELEKEQMNAQRAHLQLCKTRYPLLLVHGVFFRDSKYFNYWGRIPRELERNGATVYYGEHQSADAIADSAQELKDRILQIVSTTGCEKVNILAHSKGGLDCRYAIDRLGIGPYVASLTTISTPHRGCLFADHLLEKAPEKLKRRIAHTYDTTLKKLGDPQPDFLAAVNDLRSTTCTPLDRSMPQPPGIVCQSVGSLMPRASSGRFPLDLTYPLVKHYDGPNDGLVREDSFRWGDRYTLLEPTGTQGISHADMVDLDRKNIRGFDVREFYVQLVADLKNRGL